MANTQAGSKFYICVTPKPIDLTGSEYAALTWVEVKQIGAIGETGVKTNLLNYDTMDTKVTQKAKGISDAGSPTLEVARVPTDAGQIAVRAAALTNLNYATKRVNNDPATVGGVGTIFYNRGLISGPTRPNGRNEDFDVEIFTFAYQQIEIVVDPS